MVIPLEQLRLRLDGLGPSLFLLLLFRSGLCRILGLCPFHLVFVYCVTASFLDPIHFFGNQTLGH